MLPSQTGRYWCGCRTKAWSWCNDSLWLERLRAPYSHSWACLKPLKLLVRYVNLKLKCVYAAPSVHVYVLYVYTCIYVGWGVGVVTSFFASIHYMIYASVLYIYIFMHRCCWVFPLGTGRAGEEASCGCSQAGVWDNWLQVRPHQEDNVSLSRVGEVFLETARERESTETCSQFLWWSQQGTYAHIHSIWERVLVMQARKLHSPQRR